jgi:uncharacterized protein YndB with AHSA1/START domain
VSRAFRLDRTLVFDREPDALWEVLSRLEDFPRWWTWLRTLEADGLTEGSTARCLIRAPIPWSLQLAVRIDRVVPGELIVAYATGDLEGPARLELAEHPAGSQVRLVWELEPRRVLASLGLVARPVLRWGQDWVVSTGVRQFRRRALA